MNRLNDVMSEIPSLCLHILPAESNPILQFSFIHRLMVFGMPDMVAEEKIDFKILIQITAEDNIKFLMNSSFLRVDISY